MNSDATPPADAEAWFRKGQEAWNLNEPSAAAIALANAHALAPTDAAIEFALGCALLKSGDLRGGFPHYNRWREREAGRRAAPRLPIRRWMGEGPEGRHILVWGEDGFGDQIMYLRYALELQRQGAKISWVCPPPLARLIESAGIIALPNDQSFTISDADFYCPSSALAFAYGETLQTVRGEPYLDTQASPPSGNHVGVMTFSAPHHGDGTQKTLPVDEAARLTSCNGVVNLDPRSSGAKDFHETARIIKGLNVVVTVDTAVAHLAGGLGVRTLVLLPHVADWRWFTKRDDSPWYKSVSLVRQRSPGDWQWPLEQALAVIAETRSE